MRPWNFSPVLAYECVLVARRWQTYAARTVFLAALLVSLGIAWALRSPGIGGHLGRNTLAAIGEAFFLALSGTQLVLVLLAAPAYLAGSVCLDKARGSLAHVLVTDLSAAEIILGKLGARGLPVLGLLLAGVPVVALATLLGGIEPEAVIASFSVSVAVALVSCAMALCLSVWGDRPHEVLLATYLAEGIWLLALPVWHWLGMAWSVGPPPAWLEISNPFALAFAAYAGPTRASLEEYATFFGICAALSAVFTLCAALTLRRAVQRGGGHRVPRWRWPRLLSFGLATPALDFNPVLWREWRRRLPSLWLRAVWAVYAVLSVGASLIALAAGSRRGGETAAFVNAFQFSVGLLLVAVTAVASLFEERVNGSLDVLLVTPLPTASIVRGKWWASYRLVAQVSLLPALLAYGVAVQQAQPGSGMLLGLLVALMLAYGALVNSLGLALATWVPRFGVAFGAVVAVYVLLAAGPVLLLLASGPGDTMRGFACLSPWYGVGEITFHVGHGPPDEQVGWKVFWLLSYAGAAFGLTLATERTFDRCLGRAGGGS